MSRIVTPEGKQRLFLEEVKAKTGLTFDQLAKKLGLCGRTIRDWRREKYHMSLEAAQRLSKISGVEMPKIVDILPAYWSTRKAGKIGWQVRNRLHGNPGTPEGRKMGGRRSQFLRRAYPEKYPDVVKRKQILRPKYSSELAELVGIMLGDGHLGQWQVVVSFNTSTDRQYMKFVCALFQELFGLEASAKDRKNHSVIVVSSVELVDYLVSVGLQIGNKVRNQVDIPDWIFENQEYMKGCIRGLIDTDGNVARKNYHAKTLAMQISFRNESEPLLWSARRILLELGFAPSKITQSNHIHLTRKEDIKKYIIGIGFSNSKHIHRIQNLYEQFGGVA